MMALNMSRALGGLITHGLFLRNCLPPTVAIDVLRFSVSTQDKNSRKEEDLVDVVVDNRHRDVHAEGLQSSSLYMYSNRCFFAGNNLKLNS